MGRIKYGYLKCPPGFKEKMRRGHTPKPFKLGFIKHASDEARKQEEMAEATKVVEKKKIVRSKAGFRRVMVTLSEANAKVLDEMAAADMRQGGATEMLSVLVARNFDVLVKGARPAQSSLPLAPKDLTIKEAE